MFLINVLNKKSPSDAEKYIQEHRAFLDKCYERKKLVVSGRTVSPTEGFIIAYNCTRAELEELLKEDPLHVRGLVDFRITEFNPTKYAPGFDKFIESH